MNRIEEYREKAYSTLNKMTILALMLLVLSCVLDIYAKNTLDNTEYGYTIYEYETPNDFIEYQVLNITKVYDESGNYLYKVLFTARNAPSNVKYVECELPSSIGSRLDTEARFKAGMKLCLVKETVDKIMEINSETSIDKVIEYTNTKLIRGYDIDFMYSNYIVNKPTKENAIESLKRLYGIEQSDSNITFTKWEDTENGGN